MIKEILLKDRHRIIIITLVGIILSLMSIFPQDLFGNIVDSYTNNQITIVEVKKQLLKILIIAITFFVLQGLNEIYMFYGYSKNLSYLQKLILEKVLKQNPELYNKISIGEIMSRITEDTENIASFFGWGYYGYIKGILEVMIIFIYLFFKIDLIFVILINIPYIIATIFTVKFTKTFDKRYSEMVSYSDKISKKTLESIKGIRIFRTYNLFDKINRRFDENVENYSKANLIYSKYNIYPHAYNILGFGFSYFFLIIYGYYQYSLGNVTIGNLISVSLIMFLMPWPYTMLSSFIIALMQLNSALNRLKILFDIDDTKLLNESGKNLEFKDKIEFKNFNFSYKENEVLKNINLVINKGETIGIIGKTGSGKTTLVKQLLRFFSKTKNIYIDGKEINEYNLKSLRENFGYIPQEYFIFSSTIKENILFNRNLEDKLEESLEISDLSKDIKGFKDGLDTLVGENGISLSGGQKQRLSIARAIISNPNILIFDDSLSALDIRTEKNIIKRLNEIRKGKTNIIISHRITSVINANKIIILNNGTIEKIGTHSELLETSIWYKELYEYQNKEELKNAG